jgi:hypothetical protein
MLSVRGIEDGKDVEGGKDAGVILMLVTPAWLEFSP